MPASSISVDGLPEPKGHYSHAVVGGGLLFISGQLPIQADRSASPTSFAEQTEVALGNLLRILEGAGGSTADLLKVTAYIVGVENWSEFNSIYARIIGSARPARAVVPVSELHYDFLIEIDAVACVDPTSGR
jgi:reactive intermediate/imine deaminase